MPRIYLNLIPEVKELTDQLRGDKDDPTTPYGVIRAAVAMSLGYEFGETELIPIELPDDAENVAGLTAIVEAGAKDAEHVVGLHSAVADALLVICMTSRELYLASGCKFQIETDFRTGGHHGNIYKIFEGAHRHDLHVRWGPLSHGWGETVCRVMSPDEYFVYPCKKYGPPVIRD